MRHLPGILFVLLAGCTTAVPALGTRAYTTTWKDDVGARLRVQCGACHGPTAAGGYRVDTYPAALTALVAGDPASAILTVLDPVTAAAPHAGFATLHALLVTWVVTDLAAYERSDVHGGGIQNPASADFHGEVLRRSGWNFPLCQTCHGVDFAGGSSGVTCLTCHVDKPTSCTTCHGDSLTSGAHRLHVVGGPLLAKKLVCAECHITPSSWDSPGHILDLDGTAITSPVRAIFGALAQSPMATRTAPAAFDGATCTNVYCHDTQSPSWTSTAPSTCVSCHGQPPPLHPVGACVSCHKAVIDASGTIVDSALHISGKTTLGDGDGTCRACHTLLGGAHTSHLEGTNHLAAPVACAECHVVPTQVSSPGHFTADGRAAVFPAGGAGPLANADGAMPTWSPGAMRCAGTYCHGSGAKLAKDTSPEIVRAPPWVPGSGAGRCGTCHGLPPLDGVHDPAWPITVCSQCHAKSVDASGAIVFTGNASTHMNGVVDAP